MPCPPAPDDAPWQPAPADDGPSDVTPDPDVAASHAAASDASEQAWDQGAGEAPAAAPTPPSANAPETAPADTAPKNWRHEPPRESALAVLRDNVEAIVIAVVLALVIKQFCVEAFEIPTPSMEPTLMSTQTTGTGDRILVDKIAYWLHDPARWEIVVFKYPLDRSRNFIKRCLGLGGERLRIGPSDGDIWISKDQGVTWGIARKPRDVREDLFLPVYPPPGEVGERDGFEFEGDDLEDEPGRRWFHAVDGPRDSWHLGAIDRFAFRGGAAATFQNRQGIGSKTKADDWHRRRSDDMRVHDMRVQATVAVGPDESGSHLTLSWRADGEYLYKMHVSATEAYATIHRDDQLVERVNLDGVRLEPGSRHPVEMEVVDGDLRVWWDGRERAVLPDHRPLKRSSTVVQQRLQITAAGAPLVLEDLRIDRDLFYENGWNYLTKASAHGLDIPEDHYVMLGDNTYSSSDSRRWQIQVVPLRGGGEIRHDAQPSPPVEETYDPTTRETWYAVTDVEGVRRRWRAQDEDPERDNRKEYTPFVPRDNVIGRAFVVFWPLTPNFPHRLRWLH